MLNLIEISERFSAGPLTHIWEEFPMGNEDFLEDKAQKAVSPFINNLYKRGLISAIMAIKIRLEYDSYKPYKSMFTCEPPFNPSKGR